jgi:hypothetical protein
MIWCHPYSLFYVISKLTFLLNLNLFKIKYKKIAIYDMLITDVEQDEHSDWNCCCWDEEIYRHLIPMLLFSAQPTDDQHSHVDRFWHYYEGIHEEIWKWSWHSEETIFELSLTQSGCFELPALNISFWSGKWVQLLDLRCNTKALI